MTRGRSLKVGAPRYDHLVGQLDWGPAPYLASHPASPQVTRLVASPEPFPRRSFLHCEGVDWALYQLILVKKRNLLYFLCILFPSVRYCVICWKVVQWGLLADPYCLTCSVLPVPSKAHNTRKKTYDGRRSVWWCVSDETTELKLLTIHHHWRIVLSHFLSRKLATCAVNHLTSATHGTHNTWILLKLAIVTAGEACGLSKGKRTASFANEAWVQITGHGEGVTLTANYYGVRPCNPCFLCP